ncbi:MAG: M28 family peptidase [Bacteroidetes bacterium]|nr:M28 family peptidase [Bacteroidota bacterium]
MNIRIIKLSLLALALTGVPSAAQKKPLKQIEQLVTRNEAEPALVFLAADEMRGRDTGSPELNIAANYIATEFRQLGLSTLPGANGYFQQVPMAWKPSVSQAVLTINQSTLALKDDLAVLNGEETSWSGEAVLITPASEMTDNLKGKLVVCMFSADESASFSKARTASNERYAKLTQLGAAALVEVLPSASVNWEGVVSRYSGAKVSIDQNEKAMPRLWVRSNDYEGITNLSAQSYASAKLTIRRNPGRKLNTKNVIAMIPGTDPKLKEEYIMVCAHYDHIGVGRPVNNDSIYNGARDNAVGTVALLMSARYFSKFPAKRSMLFMACTGEEKGLLGSEWYANHPLVPLNKTVFNVTSDGAGYNDKTRVTVLGYDRTTGSPLLDQACLALGLKASDNPKPEMDIYAGSDNYNFARKGVPAIDFSPGFTGFDEELMKYYHQPPDEAASLDYDYLMKYFKAFVYTNHLIANSSAVPYWKPGDPFEATGKALYGK